MNSIKEFYNIYSYPYPKFYKFDKTKKFIHSSATVGSKNVNKNILVVGCGTCEAVMIANTNPLSNIIGIDISKSSLKIANSIKRKYKIKNLSLFEKDIIHYKSSIKFDIINAVGVLHHIENVERALQNIYFNLKEGGSFVGMVYSDNRPTKIRERSKMFLENNFSTEDVYNWFKEKEIDKSLQQWFNLFEQNDIELADTWLNPYFKEYSKEMLEYLLNLQGFKNIKVNYDLTKTKLLFQSKK